MSEFKKFEKNIKSQFGEDGVIEEIFSRIKTENKTCVEFGAWDGEHMSNTWNLWHNHQWKAILIEGEKDRCDELKKYTKDYNVNPINAFVAVEGKNSLDTILSKTDFPENIDLLSIDIDGDDYYIFQSLKKYKPRLILIEYNPTIPPHLEMVQAEGEYFGASALALVNLAHKKGYGLVHITVTNLIFVHQNDFEKLNINEPELSSIFPDELLVYVFTSYDGKPYLSKSLAYATTLTKLDELKNLNTIMKQKIKSAVKGTKKSKKHPSIVTDSKIIPVEIFKI
ncbi:MAG: FkbM family methyltransferase [Bacteroidota bacterium]